MRTPLIVIGLLLAVLVPVGFATDDGGEPAGREAVPVTTIAHRVEALRGLRFRKLPAPQRVTAAEARSDGLTDLDRAYPVERRHADEALYTRLGLLPPGTDLREVQGAVYSEQVAGYYDPRNDRLRIVDAPPNPTVDEITLAHELTHALEDQRFELDTDRAEAGDDEALAYLALVEGTATALMFEYLNRHFSPETAIGGLLQSAFGVGDTSGIPPFVLAGLLFPYESGQIFVSELYGQAGNRWTLVDLAISERPPVSTEQILHPAKWIAVEVPEPVAIDGAADVLGAGWERLATGTFGEWQTLQLLRQGGGDAGRAATGWGGDRYEVYERGDDVAVVLRWRTDTERDAEELAPALRSVADGLDGAAVAAGPREVTLALAPDAAQARRLAGA